MELVKERISSARSQKFSLVSLLQDLPEGWRSKLLPESQADYFLQLDKKLRSEFTDSKKVFPAQKNIFRALHSVDYDDVKVVILGQDPYHGEGQATGLSFSVPNSLKPKPSSLRNIFKEIESDLGVKVDREKSELSSWTEQGVLLLNTSLSVREGEAASHSKWGWQDLTQVIIQKLNERQSPVIFILWGNHAREKKKWIQSPPHFVIESVHPSGLSASRGFYGSKPFSRANEILHKLGMPPIRWEETE